MKFRYKKYGPDILRPVIPIEIIYKNKSVPYEVLIDSGADFCIFDAQIADILSVPLEEGERFEVAGITGEKESIYFHLLEIKVGGWLYEVKAAFLRKIGPYGYGVVGQKGFFEKFLVKFDLLKEEIELKPRRQIKIVSFDEAYLDMSFLKNYKGANLLAEKLKKILEKEKYLK